MMTQAGKVAAVTSIFLLLAATVTLWPHGFYTFLRIVVCATAIFLATQAYRIQKILWTWLFGAIGALFNPIFPIYMRRAQWRWFDVLTLVVLSVSLGVVRRGPSTTLASVPVEPEFRR
jgi:hypothetical protein